MRTGVRTGGKSANKRRNVVTTLAAKGLNGDEIAARLRINKNRLRAEHAAELKAGRAARKAERERAAATQPTKKERELLDIIKASFASHWFDAEFGNLLFGGARSVGEALQWVKGHRWNDRERAGL